MPRYLLAATALLLALAPGAARAETVATCTGFITALPAVIASQGTWCMDGDLATGILTGTAITISTSNVTIDCNGFKLGNLAAGPMTEARGIVAESRRNITVRNCNLRGFHRGIDLPGADGGGHQLLGNRLDGIRYIGISIAGEGNVVRGNQLFDTGGAPGATNSWAISVDGLTHVIDNTIAGVTPGTVLADGAATGIGLFSDNGAVVEGNRLSGISSTGTGHSYGIRSQGFSGVLIDRNSLTLEPGSAGTGLACVGAVTRARDNVVYGFTIAIDACGDDGNVIPP